MQICFFRGYDRQGFQKFADRVHEQSDQIFVVPASDVHTSRDRGFVVHKAHDVQGDAPEGT